MKFVICKDKCGEDGADRYWWELKNKADEVVLIDSDNHKSEGATRRALKRWRDDLGKAKVSVEKAK